MSETPANYGNEPESVRIDRALTGLQQSVDGLAAFMRKTHGIEAPNTKPLSAEELENRLTEIRWQLRAAGEKLSNPLAALDALKSVDAKLQALIEDVRKVEGEDGKA